MANEEHEKVQLTQDDLYKSLKKHDIDILHLFGKDDISNSDYFFAGINSDIMSNALSILINEMTSNLESVGVDNNCRAIIEAFVILKMEAVGDISDLQKEIYRYQYSLVDLDNFKKVIKEEDKQHPNYQSVIKDRAKAVEAIIKHLGCKEEDLLNYKIASYDPNFYLKHTLKEKINFASLLEKYPVFDEKISKLYEFFSLYAHPHFENNLVLEEGLNKVRQIYINQILDYVFKYLINTKLIIKDDSMPSFYDDFWGNPLLENNVVNIKTLEQTFILLEKMLCDVGDKQFDSFLSFYLEKMRYLTIDMLISMSMGYKEQVISKFKSFIEYTSIFVYINMVNSEGELNNLKRAFLYSSRLQLEEHLISTGIVKDNVVDTSVLKKLYETFYKEKYGLNDYQEFERNIRKNSLYFLSKNEKNYTFFVKTALKKMFLDEEEQQVMSLYKISKDMNHAGGYNFNSSEGIWDSSCWRVLIIVWKCLIQIILRVDLTYKEHGIECDIKIPIEQLKLFLQVAYDELEKVIKSYL